ncbi:MAG TPA: RNA polymerase sigma factor [Candidatus Cloacimonadota bacterium]|nr:RNA polymerase sigma factor [Candidatus Cloacimonadota bacterium]HPS38411.1 RNA polymerase sigma factor [Candidatus Cloacimonadota bacterium]
MSKDRFEEFLTANEKRIYHYIWALTHHEADAQDVVQATFIAFYEHIDGIEESSAVSYLYRIAHNKSITHIKQRGRYVQTDPVLFANLPDKPAPAPDQDYTPLHAAIASLPVKLATVIQLQYFESLSYKQISAQLGISVKAVESLCVRAKKLLRKKLLKVSSD